MAPPAPAKIPLRGRAARHVRTTAALEAHDAGLAGAPASSLRLTGDLHQVVHLILAAQEAARGALSRGLRNEVGQILLAIGVQLASLQQEARRSSVRLGKDLADTRVLAVRAAASARRLARRLGKA